MTPEILDQYKSDKGESQVASLKPNLVVFKVIGHLDKAIGRRTMAAVEKAMGQQRPFHLFCDWAETTGYDSEVRSMFTQFVATNRLRLKLHVLVGSKIVSMGVSVANLALGGILIGYTNRTAFEAVLRSTRMGLADLR